MSETKHDQKQLRVIKRKTEKVVEGAYVIFPKTDRAAKIAISVFAEIVHNDLMRGYIRDWLAGKVGKRSNQYLIVDAKTNEEVDDAFVLLPEDGFAARVAVTVYAFATEDTDLGALLLQWMRQIREKWVVKHAFSE